MSHDSLDILASLDVNLRHEFLAIEQVPFGACREIVLGD
jgi:hypothetical protein